MDYQKAMIITEERYRPYIVEQGRYSKKEGRFVSSGYMAVDGRVLMVNDEATDCGEKVKFETSFSQAADQWLCFAVVDTPRGSTTAHARVFLDATTGADLTNPFEVAETSAIGRALGFLGYGLFGGGIASADDIERVTADDDRPIPDMTSTPPSQEKPASERQIAFLTSMLQQSGFSPEEIAKEVAAVKGNQRTTSNLISALREQMESRLKGQSPDPEAARKAWWAQAREAMQRSGKTQDDMREYIRSLSTESDNEGSTKNLSPDQKEQVLAWLNEPAEENVSS